MAPVSHPLRITGGRDGALWFTNAGNDSIGRITTAGKITRYRAREHRTPAGIAAGPDGALWFTNADGDSIGRITHGWRCQHLPGRRHQWPTRRSPPGLTAPSGSRTRQRLDRADHDGRARSARSASASISSPSGIAAGPGRRALVHQRGGNSIGRITTDGTVTHLRHASISNPRGSRSARTAPSGSPTAATTRSGGSRPSGMISSCRHRASAARTGSRSGPDGALWFTNYGNDSIGRITTRRQDHAATGTRASRPAGIAPGRTARSGSPTAATTRSGGSRPAGTITNYRDAASATRSGSRSGPTARSGSPTAARLDRADHDRRARSRNYTGRRHQLPVGDHGRAGRRALVHQLGRYNSIAADSAAEGKRSGGSRRGNRNDFTIEQSGPFGIASGPDGALWFTNYGSNSIGRITTAGTISHLHRDPSIRVPYEIALGAGRCLWFTNRDSNSIGRITTAGTDQHLSDTPSIHEPQGDRGSAGTARSGSPTTGDDTIGRITTVGIVTSFKDDQHPTGRGGSRRGRTARSGSPTSRESTPSGGSPRPEVRSAT